MAATALDRLAQLIARFDDAATPYTALRRARFDYAMTTTSISPASPNGRCAGEDEVVIA